MITEYDDASHLLYVLLLNNGYVHAVALGLLSQEQYTYIIWYINKYNNELLYYM